MFASKVVGRSRSESQSLHGREEEDEIPSPLFLAMAACGRWRGGSRAFPSFFFIPLSFLFIVYLFIFFASLFFDAEVCCGCGRWWWWCVRGSDDCEVWAVKRPRRSGPSHAPPHAGPVRAITLAAATTPIHLQLCCTCTCSDE